MAFTHSQLTYLEHLGIDVWLSRPVFEQLEQTHPEPQNPVAALQMAASTVSPMAQTAAAAVSVSSEAPHGGTPAPVLTAATPAALLAQVAPTADVVAPATQSAPAPRFNIQFWCYSSGVWVISGEVELSPQHHMLVHNVAHFLQGKKRKPRHVGIFSWPMLDAPNIDQGGDIATKYLKQHIAQLQNLTKCKTLLAFDDSATWLSHMSPVIVPCSLSELLTSVDHKKALWQQLLPHQL
ncbi:MAG: hypothetical protein RPR40_13095 [Bermanella sp.]